MAKSFELRCMMCGTKHNITKLDKDNHYICGSCIQNYGLKLILELVEHNKKADEAYKEEIK